MYNSQDRFYLSLKINNVELPLDIITLKSITLNSNVQFCFPTASIIFADNTRYFDSLPILDGAVVEISSGTDYTLTNKPTYNFRVFSVKHQDTGTVVYYTIECILNAPKFINENFKGSYTDTSSNVIKSIAELSGLTSVVDDTTDNQVWYGTGTRRCYYAKQITESSYLNTTSCFKLGLTLDAKLKLKNISAINLANTNNIFVQGNKLSKDVISVLDKKESTNSGFLNNIAAYKLEGVEQTTDNFTSHTELQLPVKSTSVNINTKLNSGLSGSALKTYPVSSGNTHSNFYQAKYQNLRIAATFGNSLFIMFNQESQLDLFDPIKYALFENINSEVKLNNKLSGGYIITGKAIYIIAGAYYEKLQITRQGYNLDVISAADKKIIGID